jgi:hypothetical protein
MTLRIPLLVTQEEAFGRTHPITWAMTRALADRLDEAGARRAAKTLRCCRRSRTNPPPDYAGLWVRCRRRYCPSCSAIRARRAAKRARECLVEAFACGGAAEFLTLNPPQDPAQELHERISHLLAGVARIRNRKGWRGAAGGYLARVGMLFALEIGVENLLGHPHLHILIWSHDPESARAASAALKRSWCAINPTAEPSLQVLERVENSMESIQRVAAYVTKGTRLHKDWSLSLLASVVEELSSGRRHLGWCGLASSRRPRVQAAA